MQDYQKHVSVLEKVTISHAQNTIDNNQTATYFIGRGTCPYCRKFAGKLYDVVNQTNAKIFYINSEESGQENVLRSFRTTYGIPTVPGFMQITSGKVAVKCDSSMSVEAIKAFANL